MEFDLCDVVYLTWEFVELQIDNILTSHRSQLYTIKLILINYNSTMYKLILNADLNYIIFNKPLQFFYNLIYLHINYNLFCIQFFIHITYRHLRLFSVLLNYFFPINDP